MPAIPAFMLKKLYLKGSLKNVAEGFEFQIKNTLAPGTITALLPIEVDGKAFPAADTFISRGEEKIAASAITKEKPTSFGINTTVTMMVKGATLAPGSHTLGIGVVTKEAGELKWDISDTVASVVGPMD
jgi:hydroxymethylglutaryl-CoA reductase (NADPH)